jgi:hypothetical protein
MDGTVVGVDDGTPVGTADGTLEARNVGLSDIIWVGVPLGSKVTGAPVGSELIGAPVGSEVRSWDGLADPVGGAEGVLVRTGEGAPVGAIEGIIEGVVLGTSEGKSEGISEGSIDGISEGASLWAETNGINKTSCNSIFRARGEDTEFRDRFSMVLRLETGDFSNIYFFDTDSSTCGVSFQWV